LLIETTGAFDGARTHDAGSKLTGTPDSKGKG